MEKIKNLDEAQQFVRAWAKKWSQRIIKVEYESDNHIIVELSRFSVVNVTTLIELDEVFKSVLVARVDDRLCIIPYIDV